MLNIGEKIKSARKSKGIKQSELADMLNLKYPELKIGNTTISNYEVNRSKPDIDTLNAIRQTLELSADYFFEQKEKPATNEDDGLPKLDERQRIAFEKFLQLTDENRAKVEGYTDSLIAGQNKR